MSASCNFTPCEILPGSLFGRSYFMFRKISRVLVVSILLSVLLAMTSFAADARATAAFDKVNSIRVQNGLAPLSWSVQIENAATVRAQELVRSFSHTRPDGTPWYTADVNSLYGENLAEHYRSAEDVVNAWMASPTHKANILKGEFKSGAISVYEINGTLYWAQEFGY